MKTQNILGAILAAAFVLTLLLSVGAALADDEPGSRFPEARSLLNEERYRDAAEAYAAAREPAERAGENAAVAEALYWEAFARYRMESPRQLRQALVLLEEHQLHYSAEASARQAEALHARIAGQLAEHGDVHATEHVHEMAHDEHGHEETRLAALHALMNMDPERAVPILEKIIRGETESSLELRQNAVWVLCQTDPERGAAVLVEMLPTIEDSEMMQVAVMCLGENPSDGTFDALAEILRTTDDDELAGVVLMTLGRHDPERSFDLLAGVIRDRERHPEIRAHALIGLAESDDPRVTALMIELLSRPDDPEVQETALMIAHRSDDPEVGKALMTMVENEELDEDVRAMALFAAGRSGNVSVEKLKGIYAGTDNVDMKMQIFHVLTQLPDQEQAVGAMLELIRAEKDPDIRSDAVFWLGQFDDPRVADFLVEIINEESR